MKASQLDPQPRRLLKHAARVDPNPTKLDPRDEEPADTLVAYGLVDRVPMFGGRHQGVQITDAGRDACR